MEVPGEFPPWWNYNNQLQEPPFSGAKLENYTLPQ